MNKIMAIDYGDARTGVAISDLLCSIVGSSCVVPSRNTEKAIMDIVKLAKDNMVGTIVVGLPRNMDGSEGPGRNCAGLLRRSWVRPPVCPSGCGMSAAPLWRPTISSPSIITRRKACGIRLLSAGAVPRLNG